MSKHASIKDTNKNNLTLESIPDDPSLAFLETRDPTKTSKNNPDGALTPGLLNVARAKMLIKGLTKFIDANEKKVPAKVEVLGTFEGKDGTQGTLLEVNGEVLPAVPVHETPTDEVILEPSTPAPVEDTSQLAANEA